ncbi:precorrin-6A/cobalt-precorrin-6A reductase [Kribbella orskensis]|uniref:Precorrin-6A/cobalt-precorrin-6A reductase n=1 Tax=Kribbella orskensis TaxID=2512216 RepID=A0ABY2BH47_9ACTN|nr:MULTISPECIES: cobalt-precorrin-6A reductase [Kribbella]TCN38443.1 precorrin-6A/cobalt-precorrin-6A reductase [Kribbella sp. VKM Ac-2500]TCO20027.1 precorrin-6A/cobalt-precorrin-6A reductase [Kribbella orskensis]
MKVLLLGGTAEARQVAALLVVEPGVEVVSSLAGRTLEARLPEGAVRQGGFGGVPGLVDWLRAECVDAVVDATHPFAATMTAHAVAATASLGLPLLVLRRPGWREQSGDRWVWVDSAAEAAAVLRSLGARAFLTIGRQGLGEFADAGVWMLARCVDPPTPRPTWCELLLDRGPYELAGELDLLRRHRIDVLVTKDSGGDMTAAKLEAAREVGIPVTVIRRPPVPEGVCMVASADQVVGWLRDRR